jgi:phage/plasmid primase-like uncharacterized protein
MQPAKKMLGPVAGGAVRFGEPGEHLAVAEGIETALSVFQETGTTTWAALSAGGMESLILPGLPLAQHVIIAADADGRGRQAAARAAQRWRRAGREVRLVLPPAGLNDFNDLLLLERAS